MGSQKSYENQGLSHMEYWHSQKLTLANYQKVNTFKS